MIAKVLEINQATVQRIIKRIKEEWHWYHPIEWKEDEF